ncbi:hypothetical protein MCOR29_007959 [Pyricularia oryzae]|nr:hypothetical protein MCOR29_007959 [Pyricularia oryzae]KAI6337926.1 hypothetical protein MCOR30_003266 [Pyricularia oryzae]KAI6405632.1 hypothetical protein MCOR24_007834 [Pyricularia oryzae]KAI6493009.1 hypothetical protein MCOR11_006376 [Pyricularia oryzae]
MPCNSGTRSSTSNSTNNISNNSIIKSNSTNTSMNPLRLNPVGPFTTITTTPTQQSGLPPRHDSSWSVPSLATARTSNPPVLQRATRERQTLPTIKEEEEEETDERGAERREEEKQKEGQKKKKGVREYVFLLGGPGLTVPVTRRKRSVCRSRARRVWRFCTHFFVGTKMSGPARTTITITIKTIIIITGAAPAATASTSASISTTVTTNNITAAAAITTTTMRTI